MDLTLGLGGIGVLAFIVAGVMSLTRTAPSVRPWLYLVAGIGIGGIAADLIRRLADGAVDAFDSASAALLGTAVSLALLAGVGYYLATRMRPKGGGTPGKLTNFTAFVFPALLVAGGLGSLVTLAGSGLVGGAGALGSLIESVVRAFGAS
jgi:hypothetical protein